MSKVLVIEDDEILRSAYTTKLIIEGFEVDSAVDGKEGLEKAEAGEPDLILLDILLPIMDGVAFLTAYDIKNRHPNVKVIAFSNLSAGEKIKQVMDLGAAKFLTKATITPSEVTQIIKEELAK